MLADVEGVAEAYSVTGELGLRRARPRSAPRAAARVISGRDRATLPGVTRTQTMVAFEAYSHHDLEAMFYIGG